MVRRVIREQIVIQRIIEEDDAGDCRDAEVTDGRPKADPATTDIVSVQPASIETARLRFGALSSYFKQ